MKKENGQTGIVFDRDTSEPEPKLKKRKKKKIPKPDANEQNNQNNNNNNIQPTANDNNQPFSDSNLIHNQSQKLNEGSVNSQLYPNYGLNKNIENQMGQQIKHEVIVNKESIVKDDGNFYKDSNINISINNNQPISNNPIVNEEDKKESSTFNKKNIISNPNNNENDPIEKKKSPDKPLYKNNQKSNSLNSFNSNSNSNSNSNNNDEQNKNFASQIDYQSNDNSKRVSSKEDIKYEDKGIEREQNKDNELNEMQNKINGLLLLKEEYEKHVCPSVSFDREAYLMQIENMKSEIERKDKAIQSLTQTNKRQQRALEALSQQVNEKFEKLNLNLIQKGNQSQPRSKLNSEDNSTNKKHNNSLELTLKLKEKELRNAISLIGILSKDNSQLKASLDTYGEYQKKLQLLDSVKAKDAEINSLTNELNLFKKEIDEHKQCLKYKTESQANITALKEEIKRNKKEMKLLKKRSSELMVGSIAQMSHHNLPNISNQDKESRKENHSCKEFNPNQPLRKTAKAKSVNPISKQRMSSNANREKAFLKNESCFNDLFSLEEKKMLIKLYGDNNEKYEQFIKKIIVVETSKKSIENKYKLLVKQLMDKISSLDEQIEYLNQKNKESESRLKIFQCQVNEYKQGKKVYQKKLSEYQTNAQFLENEIKERKQEINILSHQLVTVKSQKIIFKNNLLDNKEEEGVDKEENASLKRNENEL